MNTEPLKAFHVDDETLYAATSREEAEHVYGLDTGASCDGEYPIELTDEELDKPQPEFDEDERQTGGTTTVRQMLAESGVAGFLAATVW